MVQIGKQYRHYKGGLYQVMAIAKHSETLEPLVVYRSLTEPEKVWARPLEMWEEVVLVDGQWKPRFSPLEAPGCQIVRCDRKTLSLRVLPDGNLQVRAPRRMSKERIDAFIAQHQDWIEKSRQRVLRRSIQLDSADPEALTQRAKAVLPQKVADYAAKMGVRPKSVRITRARTRYGSCGAKDTLNFSCYLMLEEEPQIDYVVVHELAHILHKDHSPAFYACIAGILPDYRRREVLLRG